MHSYKRKLIYGLRFFCALALIALALIVTPPMPVHAAGPICTVPGTYSSIQLAVNDAGCATIDVAAGTYNEHVTIGRSVTINGASASSTIVDGTNNGRVFNITSGTVTLSNLAIQHGNAAAGGGVYNTGTLNVTNSTFSGNSAAVNGGGIANDFGTLTVTNSTFSGNSAAVNGGGVYYAGLTGNVTNSTFSGNSAGTSGGGILSDFGTLTVTNSTFSGNSAGTGGGILTFYSGTVDLRNTIVANSTSGGNCAGMTTDGGGNLQFNPNSGCGGSISSGDPHLGALTGSPAYFPLGASSAAINLGNAATCAASVGSPNFGAGGMDQRGQLRRAGYCDSGAFEAQPASIATFAGSNQSTAINAPFSTLLQAQVTDASNNTLGGILVTFTGPGSGAGITSGGTDLTNSSGIAFFSATANGTRGNYSVTAAASALNTIFNLENLGTTSLAITSNLPNPSVVGQTVTISFTLTATAGAPAPSGNVTVSDGAINCQATLPANSCNLIFTSPGARTLTATYPGDANFVGSTSAGASQTVNKANTTTTITGNTPNPSAVGQTVMVTFTVQVNSPGSGTPSGSVSVSDGSVNCIGTVAAGTCNLTFTTAGNKTLTATYAGDSNFNTSASAGVSHTVNATNVVVQLASSRNPITLGQVATFTATVGVSGVLGPARRSPMACALSGNVTFREGATTLGSASVDANCQAIYGTTSLAVGTP